MEKETQKQDMPPVSEKELDEAFSGEAVLTNRFTIAIIASNLRIAFMEQYAPDKMIFRSAVTMSILLSNEIA